MDRLRGFYHISSRQSDVSVRNSDPLQLSWKETEGGSFSGCSSQGNIRCVPLCSQLVDAPSKEMSNATEHPVVESTS